MGWNRQKSGQAGEKSWEGENEWESSRHPWGKTTGYTAIASGNKAGSYHREKWRRAPNPGRGSFSASFNKGRIMRWYSDNLQKGMAKPSLLEPKRRSYLVCRKTKRTTLQLSKDKVILLSCLILFFSERRSYKPLCSLDIRFNFLYYWEMGDFSYARLGQI